MEQGNLNIEETTNRDLTTVNGSYTQIPIFQYNASVEAHKNTLYLLSLVQNDKKQLKSQLESAYKEIDRLREVVNELDCFRHKLELAID